MKAPKISSVSPQRRRTMQAIRSKNTKPEIFVRKLVHGLGFRFRLHHKGLHGSPDLAFIGRKKVIFVNGCFWHQHSGCPGCHVPKSKHAYWLPKLRRNVERDVANTAALRKAGWKVLTVWECELKNTKRLATRLQKFLA
jgi:DNA mismatch endonuclease (patch repair protein)